MHYFYDIKDGDEEDYYTKHRLKQLIDEEELQINDTNAELQCDMVMAYKAQHFDDSLQSYINHLKVAGLDVQQIVSETHGEYHGVLVTAPDDVLEHFARLYGVELSRDNPNWVWVQNNDVCKAWRTEITHPTGRDKGLLARTANAISRLRPVTFTNVERAMIVNKIMVNNQYADETGDLLYGYESFKQVQVYPLHESTWRWKKGYSTLSDRQLLYKYWANLDCLFKVQPMFLIEKYFSTEAAFFFLYMGFYNRMLLPLAVLGLAAFVLGVVELIISPEMEEFCTLDVPVCPTCDNFNVCPIDNLQEFCFAKVFALLFDNTACVIFSFITSLWSVVYYVLWRRQQVTMALRWNVTRAQFDDTLRPEFKERASVVRTSRFTQKQMLDITFCEKTKGCVISYICIVILLFCSIMLMILIAFYRYIVHEMRYHIPGLSEIWISVSAACIYYVIVIFALIPAMKRIAVRLSVLECNRTQHDFERAIVYKYCLLSLPPFYGVIIYLSLFKGKFFADPIEATQWKIAGAIPADTCNPAGCMIDVTIQFIVIMAVDAIRIIVRSYFFIYLYWFVKYRTARWSLGKDFTRSTRWEKDLGKARVKRLEFGDGYIEMMMSYGLVTWFAAICPLAPAFALVRHVFDLRYHAFEHLVAKRRVIGKKLPNIHTWNNIIAIITFLGIIFSGVVMTFSSTVVHRFVYRVQNKSSLKGYVRKSFAAFNTRKYSSISGVVLPTDSAIPERCYYRGYKIDMDDKQNSMANNFYWLTLVSQAIFLLVYENLVLLIAGVVFLKLKTVPSDVQLRYQDEEAEIREKRVKILNELYLKQNRRQNRETDHD